MTRSIRILSCILLLWFGHEPLFSQLLPPKAGAPLDYTLVLNQLNHSRKNNTGFEYFSTKPLTYQVWGVWNLRRKTKEVAVAAIDFSRYPGALRFVHRCDPVLVPKEILGSQGTWYVEGRAMVARIWAIGNIDSVFWNQDSTEFRLVASQNENFILERQWRTVLPHWLNYRTHGLRFAAIIRKTGVDSCRIAVVAQAFVNEPMPKWLVRAAVRVILPGLLRDFETMVYNRFKESPNQAKPSWWKIWAR